MEHENSITVETLSVLFNCLMKMDVDFSLTAVEVQTSVPGSFVKHLVLPGCDVSPCASVSSSHQSTSSRRSCSAASLSDGLARREPEVPTKAKTENCSHPEEALFYLFIFFAIYFLYVEIQKC